MRPYCTREPFLEARYSEAILVTKYHIKTQMYKEKKAQSENNCHVCPSSVHAFIKSLVTLVITYLHKKVRTFIDWLFKTLKRICIIKGKPFSY